MKRAILALAACLLSAPLFAAGSPSVSSSDTVEVRTTIEAIDHTARTVTLEDQDGNLVTMQAGPDVQGFDDLEVGDQVTFRYTEGVLLRVLPARGAGTHVTNPSGGDSTGAPYDSPSGSAPGGEESRAEEGGTAEDRPGDAPSADQPPGVMGEQVTRVVTVKDVDPKHRWITFETGDGRTVTTRVDDPRLVKRLHPGDRIEMTYTNAMLVSIEPQNEETP